MQDTQPCPEPGGCPGARPYANNPCAPGMCHIRTAQAAAKQQSMQRNEDLALGRISINRDPLLVLQTIRRSTSYVKDHDAVIILDAYTKKLIDECIAYHTGGDTVLPKSTSQGETS